MKSVTNMLRRIVQSSLQVLCRFSWGSLLAWSCSTIRAILGDSIARIMGNQTDKKVENEMETLGSFKGDIVYRDILPQ